MSRPAFGRHAGTLAALTLVAAAFLSAACAPAFASEGRIVFTADPAYSAGAAAWNSIATMWSDGTHIHTLASAPSTATPVAMPVWSFNRLWVAYIRKTVSGEIRVVRWDGARDHAISFTPPWPGWIPGDPQAMAWSPDGRYLVVAENAVYDEEAHGDRVWLIKIDLVKGTSRPLAQASASENRFQSLSYSPSGRYLAACEATIEPIFPSGQAWPAANRLLNASTGATVYTYPSNVEGIDIAPDGQHLSFVEPRPRDSLEFAHVAELRRANVDFKHRKTILTVVGESHVRIEGYPTMPLTRWSYDGSRVAVSTFYAASDSFDGPFVSNVSAGGTGFFTNYDVYADQFDW